MTSATMRTLLATLVLLASVACTKAQTESIALSNRGVKAFENGDVNQAAALFERSIALYPKNGLAHYHLGIIMLHDFNDLDGAGRELNEAANLNPRDLEVTFQLARLAMMKGEVDTALKHFQDVIEGDGGHAGALYWSGVGLAGKGKLVPADDMYRKAVKADPGYARAFNAMGVAYLENGAETEAMAVFREAIRLNPNDAESHHNLALVLMGMGNDKAAVDEFGKSLEHDPTNTTCAFNLANALIRLARYRQASFYLKKFIVEGSAQGSELVEPAKMVYNNLQRLIADLKEEQGP
ncbi:MAG: tetratricopeptide repeat protein [Deltaproteobacteria bacterium]|nr:tetratricopeptide repeat protein [Deltaproteobacteria bacterium]